MNMTIENLATYRNIVRKPSYWLKFKTRINIDINMYANKEITNLNLYFPEWFTGEKISIQHIRVKNSAMSPNNNKELNMLIDNVLHYIS